MEMRNDLLFERFRTAIDSASQSSCDSPADLLCRPSEGRPGSLPTLRRRSLSHPAAARPGRRVLMRTAPLSKRFNFSVYYHAGVGMSMHFAHCVGFLWISQRNPPQKGNKTVNNRFHVHKNRERKALTDAAEPGCGLQHRHFHSGLRVNRGKQSPLEFKGRRDYSAFSRIAAACSA